MVRYNKVQDAIWMSGAWKVAGAYKELSWILVGDNSAELCYVADSGASPEATGELESSDPKEWEDPAVLASITAKKQAQKK